MKCFSCVERKTTHFTNSLSLMLLLSMSSATVMLQPCERHCVRPCASADNVSSGQQAKKVFLPPTIGMLGRGAPYKNVDNAFNESH
uniref:Putative secreted protein n=1 Tax=Anopheles triannulatus TaxID=58253 RepID=A0A2M4B5J5_9DIPT